MPGVSWRTGVCLVLMSMTACSSQDCSCDGFEARPFPPQHYDKTVQKSAQVRVTGDGLDFVEQNIEPLVAGALPDGLSFCLPKDTSSDTKLCFPYVRDRSGYHARDEQPMCSNNTEGCQIDLVIESTEIETRPPNGLDVKLQIGGLNATIPFEARAPVIGTRITCDVTPYARGGGINDPATIGAIVGREIGRDMNDSDRACMGHALEIGSSGQRIAWNGESPGLEYAMTLGDGFVRDGQSCRRFTIERELDGRSARERAAACRSGEGEWRLVSG